MTAAISGAVEAGQAAAHTAGPWTIERSRREWTIEVATIYGVVRDEALDYVGHAVIVANPSNSMETWCAESPEVRSANARLIAAAPEMLDALKAVDAAWNLPTFGASEVAMLDAIKLVRAAVAAAEGGDRGAR